MTDETTLKTEAVELVTYGNNFIAITTQDEFQMADEYLKLNKAKQKAIEKYFNPLIKSARETHKGLCDRKNDALEPLTTNHELVSEVCSVYLAEQKRKQDQEQERLNAEAKAKEGAAQKAILDAAAKDEQAGNIQDAADLVEQAADLVVAPEQAKTVPTTYKSPAGTSSWVADLEITVDNPDAVYAAAKACTLPINCVEVTVKVGVLKAFFKSRDTKEYKANGLTVKEIMVPRQRV